VAPAVLSTADPTPEVVAVAQVSLARGISFVAHRGRLDKSGLPYVDHPGRVAERFDIVAEHVEAAAAWLHDVLEDTPITAQELLEAGILPEIVDVVRLLTRTPDVSPDEYYARIRSHPSALAVKLADIDDNTAPWRLRRLSYGTQVRLAEKYAYARRALGVD
jgi:(p)ppGpp synthase/HD superfamily hydrolase